jgi:hypothetical protein
MNASRWWPGIRSRCARSSRTVTFRVLDGEFGMKGDPDGLAATLRDVLTDNR